MTAAFSPTMAAFGSVGDVPYLSLQGRTPDLGHALCDIAPDRLGGGDIGIAAGRVTQPAPGDAAPEQRRGLSSDQSAGRC